jgi:tRNA 5-methylaminomethyl-2-thiouridine biosynthesis bifunctional protein
MNNEGDSHGAARSESLRRWAEHWIGPAFPTAQPLGFRVALECDCRDGTALVEVLRAWTAGMASRASLAKGRHEPHLVYYAVVAPALFAGALQAIRRMLMEHFSESGEAFSEWAPAIRGMHRVCLPRESVTLVFFVGGLSWALSRLSTAVHAWVVPKWRTSREEPSRSPWLAQLARHSSASAALCIERPETEESLILERAGFLMGTNPEAENGGGVKWGQFRAEPSRRGVSAAPEWSRRSAIILGAGLAGTAAAGALLRRGWEVVLVDRRESLAREASGNLAGVFSPMISRDDARAARLSRRCFLELRRELDGFLKEGAEVHWAGCGVLQMPKEPREAARLQQMVEELGFPESFLKWASMEEASVHAGRSVPSGGVFFPKGGWVNPPSLCAARLSRPSNGALSLRFSSEGMEPEYDADLGEWRLRVDRGGEELRAPVLILANSWGASAFRFGRDVTQKRVRGQVTHLPEGALLDPQCVLTRDGYLTPGWEGVASLGASYDFGSEDPALSAGSHQENLNRLSGLLGLAPDELGPWADGALEGRVGFRALTPDRFPVVGPLAGGRRSGEDWPGLFAFLGLGSRGIVWSGMLGELLGQQIEGEPLLMESDLIGAVDPARFFGRPDLSAGTE